MGFANLICARHKRLAVKDAPRISEQFATQLIDDLISLEVEDYITIREHFRNFSTEELIELEGVLNYMKRQFSIVKHDRIKRENNEKRKLERVNLTDGA